MPMKVKEREYRDFTLAVVEIENSEAEERKMVNGYASVFNTPYTLYQDDEVVIQEQVDSKACVLSVFLVVRMVTGNLHSPVHTLAGPLPHHHLYFCIPHT